MSEANEDSESFPQKEFDCTDGVKFIGVMQGNSKPGDENQGNLPQGMDDVKEVGKELPKEKNENPENLPQKKLDGTDGVKVTEMKQGFPQGAGQVKKVGNDQSKEKHEEVADRDIKETRCKILMHLLKRSRMYATELTNQIKGGKMRSLRKKMSAAKKLEADTCQDKEQVEDKAAKKGAEDTKEVKRAIQDDETDFFRETRVTRRGFTVSYCQPILVEGGVMRDYQLKGLQWMVNLFKNGVNGILADEMGLGKTLQVIGLICGLIERGMRGPFLIIAPLSTLGNWIDEFRKFAPRVPTLYFHGSRRDRKDLLAILMDSISDMDRKVLKVVITSYQVVLCEKRALSKIKWLYITVDEGHRMKNHNSLLSKTLRDFNSVGKLLLTGTPLQNNLTELWSLLNFIIPEVFNSLEAFRSWFDVQEFERDGIKFMEENYNINIITTVQQILMPFLLRREKKDVSIILPPKKEILVYCPMTAVQRMLYESTVDRSIEYLLKPKREAESLTEPPPKRACILMSNENDERHSYEVKKCSHTFCHEDYGQGDYESHIQLRNPQMQLRKIVNHPYLIRFPLIPGTNELRIDEDLVKSSGKLLVVDAMLSKLKTQGHKVVIFSTFKTMLDILQDLAHLRNYRYCRLDGSTKPEERPECIAQFNTNPEIFLFLVSMRAGGLGINLTGADTIIIYDSDWNPQINLQSQDRCHRIGQTKPVVIYKLCVRGTIDQRIIERGESKRKLEKMIIQKGKFTRGVSDSDGNTNVIDLKELKELLTSTDYDRVISSDDRVFTDEELEALLDRSEMMVNHSDNSKKEINGEKIFDVINCERAK